MNQPKADLGRNAFVIHVEPKSRSRPDVALRDSGARLAEAVGLTAAIHLDVVEAQVAPLAEEAGVTLVLELLDSKVDHPDYQADHTGWGVKVCQAPITSLRTTFQGCAPYL